jgi:hypothetical protein
MLRHIGFLGAVPPAVDGLATISFADISGYLEFEHYSNISFDENENINENEYFYEIELLKNENNLYRTKIDQIEKEKRLKEFREYANSLIENINGSVITPAQVDKLIDILEMAHQSDNNLDKIEYSDNITNVEKVKQFISALQPVFNLKKYTTNEATGIEPRLRRNNFDSYEKPGDFSDKPVAAERLMLHNKAMEIKATTPGLSYEEAVCIAVGSI